MKITVDREVKEDEVLFSIRAYELGVNNFNMDMENDGFEKIEEIKNHINYCLHVKFEGILQEIFNEFRDAQPPKEKNWIMHQDPQQVTYYFDNDKTIESDYEEYDGM